MNRGIAFIAEYLGALENKSEISYLGAYGPEFAEDGMLPFLAVVKGMSQTISSTTTKVPTCQT